MGMAYDAARGEVVLFGGRRLRLLDDTWTWDGTDWTERSPRHRSPSARDSMGMAYDAARGEVVMFGGSDAARLSATPGPGTARTGRSSGRRTAPARRDSWAWPTTPHGARSCCSAATATGRPRRHLDLGRHGLDQTLGRHRVFRRGTMVPGREAFRAPIAGRPAAGVLPALAANAILRASAVAPSGDTIRRP